MLAPLNPGTVASRCAIRFLMSVGLLLFGSSSLVAVPVVQETQPAKGASVAKLSHLLVEFSEAVDGVQASALLVDGVPSSSIQVLSGWQYLFFFPSASVGVHQFSWAADQPVRSHANPASVGIPDPWSLRIVSRTPSVALQISQFVADNKSTAKDQDGAASDWLEVYNPTAAPVSLQGWSLTTNATSTAGAWKFPNYLLDAGERLVVFASGKNRTAVTNELHTSFSLKKADGYLALLDPSGTPASEFGPGYSPQKPDTACWRDPSLPDFFGFVASPNAGQSPRDSGAEFVQAVTFSRTGGCFVGSTTVALSCATPGSMVRYTTDGTLPTVFSPAAAGPVTLNASTRLRARAFAPGLIPGPVRTETYVAIANSIANYVATLPVLILHDFGAGTPSTDVNAAPLPISALLYSTNGGRIILTNAPDFVARGEIAVHGSSTRGLPKQSYSLQFLGEVDGSQSYAPLGLPPNAHWILYAPNNFEPVLMHNPLAYRLSNDVGRYAPRTRFVVVYLVTGNGAMTSTQYNGIYVLEEEIRHGKSRIDIDRLDPIDNGVTAVTGGYVLKVDRLGPGENGLSAANQQMAFADPSESTLLAPQRAPQYQYINQYMRSFGTMLYGSNYRDPVKGYSSYIDVGAWIDHHILNVLTFNVDALRLSAYFHKPRQGKLFFGPVWDFDRTQGSTDGRDFNPRLWRSPVSDLGTDFFNYTWWDRLCRDIDFWQRWIDRYQSLRDGALSTDHIYGVIDEFAAQVRSEQPKEATRWAGLTTPRSGSVSLSGYSYNFPGGYQGEVNFLKKWYGDRLTFMDTNFLSRPVLASNAPAAGVGGFLFSIGAPLGATVYYTTNGSDPRLPGGGIADAAMLYSAPVALGANSRVRARSYDLTHRNLTGANKPPLSSPWSGERDQVFGVVTAPDHVAYSIPGSTYLQDFSGLAAAGTGSVGAANPVLVNGSVVALANPFALAAPAGSPGAAGGLGLPVGLAGWWSTGDFDSKFGVSSGDQATGGLISFGLAGGNNRSLGLLATGSTGPTALALKLVNASTEVLDRIQIGFTGSLWRQSPKSKTLEFTYLVATNPLAQFSPLGEVPIHALDVAFAPATSGSTPQPVNGAASANRKVFHANEIPLDGWVPGSALWLIWRMNDASGGGQGMGIDGLTFAARSANGADGPALRVTRAANGVEVHWPASAVGWTLQRTGDLTAPAAWTPADWPVVSDTDGFYAIVPAASGTVFVRLSR